MTTARDIAAALGMATADTLSPPRLRPDEGAAAKRQAWSAEKKLAFKVMAPAALCLVASDGPVSLTLSGPDGERTHFGHNRGVWPARLAKGQTWRDMVTQSWDRNPLFYVGTQIRVWTPSEAARDALADAVAALIEARADEAGSAATLRHGFLDLGPELDLPMFEIEMHEIGRRLGVATWDDEGLSRWLDRLVARAKGVEGWRARPELALRETLGAVLGT